MTVDAPILIGSPPSSGSTLLSVMLDAHPDVACGPELCILGHPLLYRDFDLFRRLAIGIYLSGGFTSRDTFCNVSAGLSPYAFAYDDNFSFYGFDQGQVVEIFQRNRNVDDFLSDLFGPLLKLEGKRRFAEKSPTNIYAVPEFLDALPAGRAICLIRDPLDQIWSLKRRGFSFGRALSIWLVETAICLEHAKLDRVMLVRFEELVRTPEKICEDIEHFLGMTPAVGQMLDYVNRSKRVKVDSSIGLASWSHNPREALSSGSIGNGRPNLQPQEIYAIHHAALTGVPDGLAIRAGETAKLVIERCGYDVPSCPNLDVSSARSFLASEGLLSGSNTPPTNFQERMVCCPV